MTHSQASSGNEAENDSRDRPLSTTIRVEKPVTEVFDFLADGTHDPCWLSWVATSELLAYGGGVGASYRQSLRGSALGRREVRYRVVHLRRPSLLGVEATSLPGRPLARFRLAPLGPTTTEVVLTIEVSGTSGSQGPAPIGRRWATHMVASLPQLKACLESSVS